MDNCWRGVINKEEKEKDGKELTQERMQLKGEKKEEKSREELKKHFTERKEKGIEEKNKGKINQQHTRGCIYVVKWSRGYERGEKSDQVRMNNLLRKWTKGGRGGDMRVCKKNEKTN